MNPFLQILNVDPGIQNLDGQKTGDNIIGVLGEAKNTDSNIDFSNLLANIDILNADSEHNCISFNNIADNTNNKPLLKDNNTLQLLSGLGINEIQSNTGDSEKIEIKLSAGNNVKVSIPDGNVIKSPENETSQQSESPRQASEKTFSFQQPQLNLETEIQKQQSESRPVAFRAVPTNLPKIQNPNINHNVVPTDKNDLTTFLTALNDHEPTNIQKTDSSDILFRTNIRSTEKTNQPFGHDIFNQKLNLLNLRQVDLTDKYVNPVTDSETGRNLPAEKVSSKADSKIPILIRDIPIGAPIKNNAAIRMAPRAELPVLNTDGLINTDITDRSATADANTTGNNNFNNLLMNDPGTGKRPGDTFAKTAIGGFAKALGGEIAASSLNDIAKVDSAPVKSEETTVRFIVPNKLLENGGSVNRTITIKMEPEHLGTIRLTLSSINHGLIGRMVVENAAAHTIVESNIDNLFSQLSDKGIKLDAFSVSVGGDSDGKKSSQYRKPFRMNNRGSGNIDINRLKALHPVFAEAASNRMYINSHGVNWLA